MAKRVAILGACGTDEDAKAVRAVARFVADAQPDEVVCIEGSTTLLEHLREGYDGPLNVHGSTTDESFDAVLDGFGARLLPEYYRLAPGWITTDKDDQCPPSRIAGNTALNAAIKFGTSVVMGHTHRQGIASKSGGFGGSITQQLTGVEVGHLMDIKKLRARIKTGKGDVIGSAFATTLREMNLQQGFGLLTVDGEQVEPEVVPITRGMFTVDGEVWEL